MMMMEKLGINDTEVVRYMVLLQKRYFLANVEVERDFIHPIICLLLFFSADLFCEKMTQK
jgi:hypothetical protein